jgi:hypothetical protein
LNEGRKEVHNGEGAGKTAPVNEAAGRCDGEPGKERTRQFAVIESSRMGRILCCRDSRGSREVNKSGVTLLGVKNIINRLHPTVAKSRRNFSTSRGNHDTSIFVDSNVASVHGFREKSAFRAA